MTSNRPYLLRALNEWILDNRMTPHLLIDAEVGGVQVPDKYTENGKVVLNISPSAVKEIDFSNEFITFDARFGGISSFIRIPVKAVLAIYAKENGMGMIFPEEVQEKESVTRPGKTEIKNHLKVIK